MDVAGKILSTNLFPVVGIGASAGGLEAFKKLIKAIPQQSGMAYVLVQHLAPTRESQLPELLQQVTPVPVLEISDDMKVQPDHIYILPSNKMLVANDGVLQLSPRPKEGELNRPIDLFFTSLAEIHQSHAIGVVLSGTGSDGTKGLKAIKEYGGITLAQDEASAEHAGMPRSAAQAGVVDFVLPPEEIPQKVLAVIGLINGDERDESTAPSADNEVFRQLLALLRVRRGTDFTYYKQTTIRRRILRRIAISQLKTPAEYLQYVQAHKPEQDVLYQDLLIPVTHFFRDHPVFDNLCDAVFPHLTDKNAGDPIRIWVAGCSTGQEAYSIAMCFTEFLGDRPERVQIFATDLSEPAIAKARTGIYATNELDGVSPKRLQEFFVKINGKYQINKQVRDMCVFAAHNFLKDPPFVKMDFISCRNVLIYMEPYLQQKALTTFHYALKPDGFLLLGKSETTSPVPTLFALAVKSDKLFTRSNAPTRFMPVAGRLKEEPLNAPKAENEAKQTDFQKTADELILSQYSPAGVVVNEALDIVHFRGNTGPYLEQSPGKPTHNLLLLARTGLAFELRNMVHKAKKDQAPAKKEHIPLPENGRLRTISIEAIPLPNTIEPHYLVLFHEMNSPTDGQLAAGTKKATPRSETADKDLRIHQLEQELVQARQDMVSITEDQEVVNEELQSANEELLSGNEELQSLNEELESSKEELQGTNEELTVVNQEMVSLNEQVTVTRDYAEAIIANIREPLLVLDHTLRVQRANNAFYKTFRVHELETEDILIYELGNSQWNIPQLRDLLEKILPEKSTFHDFELTHTFTTIGKRTMLLNARQILSKKNTEKLILLSIEDITDAANAQHEERQAKKRFQFIADAMPQKVWTADGAGHVDYYNQTWLTYTGLTIDELNGWGWQQVVHPDDGEETKKRWQHSINTGDDFDVEHRFLNAEGDYKWHLSRGLAQKDETGRINLWIGTSTEIHEQKTEKEALEKAVVRRTRELQQANQTLAEKNGVLQQMNKELEAFTYVSSHDLQEPLRKIQALAGRILDQETLTPKGNDYFRRMQQAAERMQQLIQDLLAFSRLSTAERKFEIMDLSLLVEDIVSELQETIEDKRATIDTTKLGSAHVNGFQFAQLLHNLIGNALKFSNPAIPPHIRIESQLATGSHLSNLALLPEKSYCHISVTDNGIGFEAQYSEKIFNVFQRLHGRDQYTGTGIGLAIVKKIVENHQGIITATSEVNKGTRFDLYIPTA